MSYDELFTFFLGLVLLRNKEHVSFSKLTITFLCRVNRLVQTTVGPEADKIEEN